MGISILNTSDAIRQCSFNLPIGKSTIIFDDRALLAHQVTEEGAYLTPVYRQLMRDFNPKEKPEHPIAVLTRKELEGYFAGECKVFTMPIFLSVEFFSEKVLLSLKDNVPFGSSITYKELAAMAGNPRAARAVGTAIAYNPISIIVPSHRIVRQDSQTEKFSQSGGTQLKQRLLKFELNGGKVPF